MKRNYLILLCLILFIVSIACVSATEDVNQTDNLELSMNSNSEDKVDLDNNNGLDENDDLSEKLESDSNILAMSKADKLTGKEIDVENFTFKDIQKAVDSADEGDTVYLKAGTYLNNENGEIYIDHNNISIVGVKDSTILDAQKTSRIFNINAKNGITIKDIVFINGKTDGDGGAIFVNQAIDNVNIDATFINNTANYGGANYFRSTVSDSYISGTYINNTAEHYGGANHFENTVSNVNISGTYINNTADGTGLIYFFDNDNVGLNVTISDAIFINNKCPGVIYVRTNGVVAYNNWFGNNATNYNEKPKNHNVNMINWLFLNATADSSRIGVENSSKIAFVLQSYNGTSDVGFYDASKMNVNLTLSQTLGELDKTSALIGEKILYTAKNVGNATVTGKFETVSYTLSLTSKSPTNITVANSTVDLKVGDVVDLGATLTPAGAGNLTCTSSNPSVVKVEDGKIIALAEGNATITVSFAGNEWYYAAGNKTIEVTVKLKEAEWTYIDIYRGEEYNLDGASVYLPWNYVPTCFVKYVNGTGLPAGTNVTIFCEGDENYTIGAVVQDDGQFSVNVSDIAIGKYSVTFAAGKAYKTATATIVGIKVVTEITVANSTVDLKVGDVVDLGATLTPADAGNLTCTSSNPSVVKVEDGKIIALAEGNATITVSFAGNEWYYAAGNKTIEVTVSLNDASVSVNNSTLDLTVGDTFTIVATTTPDNLNVIYIPDNSGIVSVDENGKVTALKEGNATIVVKVGGDGVYAENSTTVAVSVSKISTEIIIQNATVDMKVDEIFDPVVSLMPSNAGNLSFRSSNANVVLVNGHGMIKAVGEGKANITVAFDGNKKYVAVSKNITVSVSKIPTEITVDTTPLDLFVGDETVIVANLAPVDAGNVTFTSSDYDVVDFDYEGNVIAQGKGQAIITVSFAGDNKYAAAENKTIIINVSLGNASVTVDNDTLDLKVGETSAINATKHPDTIMLDITYTSSNNSVATVDKNGIVTAVGEGTAVITVEVGDDEIYAKNSTTVNVTVSKVSTEIESSAVTTVYNVDKNLIVTLKDADGKPISGVSITVDLNDAKTYTTDKNGQAKVSTKGLVPKAYTAKITFNGNSKYAKSTKNVKVTVKKATPKITAKAKTFKTTTKTKKYAIVLKNNVNKAINKATVYLKVGGKTYKATTNSKGKATFKITNLNKAGKFKATVTYKGNKFYNKATKKVTIKVKSVWKTVSKGSKNSAIVKKIQRALKNHGYYLEYNGRYLMVDGIYWDYTEMAVKEFQYDKVLKVTGKVDEKTAKKLGIIK